MGSLATVLMCLALTPGCASPPPTAPTPTVSAFAISYERSGGLKSLPQKLTVRPGRRAVAETAGTRAGERTVHFRIPRKAVVRLQQGLAAAHFSEIESALPGTCADCYLYTIDYRGHRVSLPQVDVPKQLNGVISQIESLVYARTIPPNY